MAWEDKSSRAVTFHWDSNYSELIKYSVGPCLDFLKVKIEFVGLIQVFGCQYLINGRPILELITRANVYPAALVGSGIFQMFRSFSAPLVTAVASASAIMAVTFLGGLTVFLISGVSDAKAKPVTPTAVEQTQAKGDRLPVLQKGATCSSRAWPNYEPNCQFDMRRPFGEMRTVRVIALR
jgi:hypothetical protein